MRRADGTTLSLAITPHTRSMNRYFKRTLTQQAMGNLKAMSDKEFAAFSSAFNSTTGELGRKVSIEESQ